MNASIDNECPVYQFPVEISGHVGANMSKHILLFISFESTLDIEIYPLDGTPIVCGGDQKNGHGRQWIRSKQCWIYSTASRRWTKSGE